MQCGNCGAPIDPRSEGLGACYYCGAAVERAEPPTVARGVDEILQALGMPGAATLGTVQASSTFVINGRSYARLEDLPPELRRVVEEKLARLRALRLG